ncbi:uncharacterized protein K02A2.6-like [Malaya genurostris]|uniref:uncharacterized protein K02A2.6-like n=1 Tax=Malaya genurostris TaxID=325434 RepID=UPI0026F3BF3F|nr:uncharacterized protein K02A2.6-like [Malaya genurostris]XP_058467148.1 uncharacterized protein K02A2.6-like [Malaya genurostris]
MRIIFFIDSGAQVNTVTEPIFNKLLQKEKSRKKLIDLSYTSDKSLRAYATKTNIKIIATFSAELYIANDRPVCIEKFYVVNENRALLGFNTATRYSVLVVGLKIPVGNFYTSTNWSCELAAVNTVRKSTTDEFPKFNVPPVVLYYDKDMPPARNVFTHIPVAYKDLTKRKLNELLSSGIIELVTEDMDRSFCSSLLVVPKGRDDIRLVVDLRGPNKYIHRTPFSMPTFEEILRDLHGAKWFSTIDLKSAFFHVVLDESCRHLTNFFSGEAMYRCCRLPFGLCNAPDIFQEIMQSTILSGCKGVVNYLDDVLVMGKTEEEHDDNLNEVLKRFQNHNVNINMDKCAFRQQSVIFLGFKLSEEGWSIENAKIQAIKNFRKPETQAEVKSFLGLINFIEKFIPQRADRTRYLRELAKADRFYWSQEHDREFQYLTQNAWRVIQTLGYYNREDVTELFVDASPFGLGAVLVQFDLNSKPRVIACAFKALSVTEMKYPQTQKEALSRVWGVEKFSAYLMSIPFTIRSDAESNEFIFGGMHRIGKRAVSRAEAWALRLQPYNFKVERVPGNQNLADALSRLIQNPESSESFDESDDRHLLYLLDAGALDFSWHEIETYAESDEEQQDVRQSLKTGVWKTEHRHYECQVKYLQTLGALIFKMDRVVLPSKLRGRALQIAHQGHMGAASMKRILRNHFWWPGLGKDIDNYVKLCETCLRLSRKNPPLPLISRTLPGGPWEILQIDFFTDQDFGYGEFLVVVDTYSRYLHVIEMRSMDACATNQALMRIFEVWGYPLAIQSDNGPPFQSDTFVKSWEDRGVKIYKSIPLSAQSNGAVERQNKGIKDALAAARLDNENWRTALDKYVHMHNKVRPLSRLGITPFEMLVGWKFRGTFPSLWNSNATEPLDRTDIKERDAVSKLKSKIYADSQRGAKFSDITIGDRVLIAQQKKRKSDPTFSADKFTVIARDGAKVVVQSDRGVQYSRNVQDIKRVPKQLEMNLSENKETYPIILDENLSDTHETTRPQRAIQKPNRFKDMILYSIFE